MLPPSRTGLTAALFHAALVCLLLAACEVDPIGPAPVASSVEIVSEGLVQEVFATATLQAAVKDQGGRVLDHIAVTWSSLKPEVADVTPEGEATGVSVGSARVVATAGALTDTATLQVVVPAAAELAVDEPSLLVGEGAVFLPGIRVQMPDGRAIPGAEVQVSVEGEGVLEPAEMARVRATAIGDGRVVGRMAGMEVVVDVEVTYGYREVQTNGSSHACAVRADGRAYCWGEPRDGRLGVGAAAAGGDTFSRPLPVAGGLRFDHLSLGEDFTCGVELGNGAWCWGLDTLGVLGTKRETPGCALGGGDAGCSDEPLAVHGGGEFSHVAAGDGHVCALRQRAIAFCWGTNYSGQLGIPDGQGASPENSVIADPVRIQLSRTLHAITTGAPGRSHGLSLDRKIFRWGVRLREIPPDEVEDEEGCTTTYCFAPRQIHFEPEFTDIQSLRPPVICGITPSGQIYCWRGAAARAPVRLPITQTLAALGRVNMGSTMCGVTGEGQPICWAWDDAIGNLGEPFTLPRGELRFRTVSTGGTPGGNAPVPYACGVTELNLAYCWEGPEPEAAEPVLLAAPAEDGGL